MILRKETETKVIEYSNKNGDSIIRMNDTP